MLMNKRNIQHLYLRGGFGINSNKLKELEDKATKDVVKELFDDSENYIPLKIDLSELRIMAIDDNKKNNEKTAEKEAKMRLQKLNRQKTKELNYAWIDRLKQPRSILKEKMTLFWANVFVCQDNNNIFHLQQYNNTLRKFALGNFKDFVKEVAKNGFNEQIFKQ